MSIHVTAGLRAVIINPFHTNVPIYFNAFRLFKAVK